MRNIFRSFVNSQIWLSKIFDKFLLPEDYRLDGNSDFYNNLLPQHIDHSQRIYDIGGGKTPAIDVSTKNEMSLQIVGIDIDPAEIALAPTGSYDETHCGSIEKFKGNSDADLVICRSVLEHVENNTDAFTAIASILKPGGKLVLFVPNKNALFARINLVLPEKLKRKILFTIFPSTEEEQGFPAFYDRCSPINFTQLASDNDLEPIETRRYYRSSYFSFFFPAYFLWRLWVVLGRLVGKGELTETFAMVMVKNS